MPGIPTTWRERARCRVCNATVPKKNRHEVVTCNSCKQAAVTAKAKANKSKQCNRCGKKKLRRLWPKDKGGHALDHCGCRSIVSVICATCATTFTKRSSRDKWCNACRPIEAQKQRNAQKERARRAAGVPARLHNAHVKLYERIVVSEKIKREKALAKIGPPWPPKFRDGAEREKYRMRTDPRHVLNLRMRVSLRKAMRGQKAGRKWERLLGYTVAQLTSHMQRQLPKGYSMQDFYTGRLHIDHIVPKSLFDVTKPEEMRSCWGLPNLRPLPAKQNLSKNDKRTHLL
jgi:hypothetical protein